MSEYRKQVRAAMKAERAKDKATALAYGFARQEHNRKFRALRIPETRHQANKRRAQRKIDQRCACCTDEQFKAFERDAHALGLHIDHRIALSLGGPHCIGNLQALTPEQHALKTSADNSAALRGKGKDFVLPPFILDRLQR